MHPLSAGELSRVVAARFEGNGPGLRIVGGRTALPFDVHAPSSYDLLSTAALNRVIDYPARDMTITVEAGLRIEDLQAALAKEHQRLPVDVPEGHRATLGGAIATNTAGPGRFGHGTFRDYVIGIRAVDGRGRPFAAGGRVVKNVAGYDLCKLMIGAYGTLGVLTEVTLKLRPIPETRRTVWTEFADFDGIDRALERLLTSATRPVALEVFDPVAAGQVLTEAKLPLAVERPVLCVAYEGTERETTWQVEQLRRELSDAAAAIEVVTGEEADRLWSAMTEFQAGADEPLTFAIASVPSRSMALAQQAATAGAGVQVHAGNGILIGRLPDTCSTPAEAERVLGPVASATERVGGSFQVLACERSWRMPLAKYFPSLVSLSLAKRIKAAFDPRGLLNPDVTGV